MILYAKSCYAVSFTLCVTIGLYHPLDGISNPKYKLLHLLTPEIFIKEKKALAFNQDR